jgi:hypothetical protein
MRRLKPHENLCHQSRMNSLKHVSAQELAMAAHYVETELLINKGISTTMVDG